MKSKLKVSDFVLVFLKLGPKLKTRIIEARAE